MSNVDQAMALLAIIVLALVFVRGVLAVADAIVDIILGEW